MTTTTRYRCLVKGCDGLTHEGPGFCSSCIARASATITVPATEPIGMAKPVKRCQTKDCVRGVLEQDDYCLFCKDNPKSPEQKPQPTMDAVVEANRALLLYRSQVGIAKYNTTLSQARLTHRQILQHALEEALDLANYLQTQIMAIDAGSQ